ncbi:ribonuclease H-like domain-containing protein [Tanacetum coccineum]
MQFLMGLDDSYMQIRSSILSRETLPDVRSAYATISSEESHRVVVGSIAGSSQRNHASAFIQGEGSGLVCENCGFNGHTIDTCFKIIGYPADFGRKKKSGQNFKKQSVSINNSVVKSQYSSNGKIVDSGANQHMTYTDKELDNVLDISHFKIKVGHPNGTKAYISKIEKLRLSNGLTLYDVMVIPEYCVTLICVHKLIKEYKVIVAFDENRCYFLNQDLNLKNVLGIGEQCEGLYYYKDKGIKSNTSTLRFQCMLSQHDWHCRLGHPADPVLNILKDSLNIDKKDNIVCCKICQRAKQTREPFLLSDHKSKSLGGLVHLDLWKPYKVTSSEGFRFFLIVVDDYTRAVWVYLIKSKDEISNNDERVANDLNKGKSDSSNSSVSGSNINTADFPVDSGNDADSSVDLVATQNKEPVFQLDMNNAFLYGALEESDKGVFLALLVYVNDIIIVGNSVSGIKKFKVFLKSKFMIKDLGKLKYFLGIEVVDTDKGICLNQRKSDISYVVHCISQFMHSPLTSHLKIAFKILRYLKSCPGLGVRVTKTSGMFFTAYSDADWAKCIITSKSVTGYCVFLNNSLVSWKSKKQNTLSKSSTEAEYSALASVTSEVIWILKFLKDLQIKNLLPVSLHCDSNSAIKIAVNPVFHKRTKHLEIDLHFVREKVLKGVVKTVKVDSANQIAHILTKGLDTIQHLELIKKLGMYDVYQVETKGGIENIVSMVNMKVEGLIV